MTKNFLTFKKQQLTYTRSNSLPSGLLPGIPEGSRLTTPSVTVSDFSVATCGSEINLSAAVTDAETESPNEDEVDGIRGVVISDATAHQEFSVTLEDIDRHRR